MTIKINTLDAHDRLLHFKKQQETNLFDGVTECLTKNKDCVSMQQHFPYVYIFMHPRTLEVDERVAMFNIEQQNALMEARIPIYQSIEEVPTTKALWQPRLMKPRAQTNSYLFRVISNTDLVEIVWLLPPREMWDQYQMGKMTESKDVVTSIMNFLHAREALEMPHEEDWSEDRIRRKLESIHA
jgi:hypothetical protein